MGEHFWALGDAHDAAIAGALDGIRQAANQLATHEPSPDLPQVARPYMAGFLEQSRVVARVATLADAGPALSGLAASCGTCHQALGRPLPVLLDDDALDSDDAPRESGPLQEGMSAHIRAADLLWEALVAPSTEAWDAGIALLSDTEIAPEAVTSSESSKNAVAGLLQRLADLAAEGEGAPPVERPLLYGQLVMTCGECHRALDRGFGRQDSRVGHRDGAYWVGFAHRYAPSATFFTDRSLQRSRRSGYLSRTEGPEVTRTPLPGRPGVRRQRWNHHDLRRRGRRGGSLALDASRPHPGVRQPPGRRLLDGCQQLPGDPVRRGGSTGRRRGRQRTVPDPALHRHLRVLRHRRIGPP